MNSPHTRYLPSLLAAVGIALAAYAAPAQDAPAAPTASAARPPDWTDRLTVLSPADPDAYFLLAEEVAASAASPAAVRLARELFALALELHRRRGNARAVASAALGLADLAPLRQDRRWLLGVAERADPRLSPPDWLRPPGAAVRPGIAASAATAIGLVRSGDGLAARQLLNDPEVFAAIRAFDAQLAPGGGGARKVQRDAEQWPCAECRNARVVRVTGSSSVRYRICGTCNGNPGPRLSTAELAAQLRVESWLLQSEQKTWAAQAAADEGAPLRDPDPADVAAVFGVSGDRPFYRNGAWVGTGAPEPPPTKPAPDPEPDTPAAPPPAAPVSSS